jgi:hypothetical protein
MRSQTISIRSDPWPRHAKSSPPSWEAAEAGLETVITRRGKPVALIGPVSLRRTKERVSVGRCKGQGKGCGEPLATMSVECAMSGEASLLTEPRSCSTPPPSSTCWKTIPSSSPSSCRCSDAPEEGSLRILVTPITVAEVLAGPLKAGREALAERYEQALREGLGWTVVPLDAGLAARAARLRVRYRIRLPDALQLAAALSHGGGGAGHARPRLRAGGGRGADLGGVRGPGIGDGGDGAEETPPNSPRRPDLGAEEAQAIAPGGKRPGLSGAIHSAPPIGEASALGTTRIGQDEEFGTVRGESANP